MFNKKPAHSGHSRDDYLAGLLHKMTKLLGLLPLAVPWGWQLFKMSFFVVYRPVRPTSVSSIGRQSHAM